MHIKCLCLNKISKAKSQNDRSRRAGEKYKQHEGKIFSEELADVTNNAEPSDRSVVRSCEEYFYAKRYAD